MKGGGGGIVVSEREEGGGAGREGRRWSREGWRGKGERERELKLTVPR